MNTISLTELSKLMKSKNKILSSFDKLDLSSQLLSIKDKEKIIANHSIEIFSEDNATLLYQDFSELLYKNISDKIITLSNFNFVIPLEPELLSTITIFVEGQTKPNINKYFLPLLEHDDNSNHYIFNNCSFTFLFPESIPDDSKYKDIKIFLDTKDFFFDSFNTFNFLITPLKLYKKSIFSSVTTLAKIKAKSKPFSHLFFDSKANTLESVIPSEILFDYDHAFVNSMPSPESFEFNSSITFAKDHVPDELSILFLSTDYFISELNDKKLTDIASFIDSDVIEKLSYILAEPYDSLVFNENNSYPSDIEHVLPYLNNRTVDLPKNNPKPTPIEVPKFNPLELIDFLNTKVISHEEPKKEISLAIYNHFNKLRLNLKNDTDFTKSNILLAGESGSGKTLIVESIAKKINIPSIIVDMTSFTESGYKGSELSTIFERLYNASDKNIEKMKYSIVVLDEIDKLALRWNSHTSSNPIQQELLKIIEGSKYSFSIGNELSKQTFEIDTSSILFIGSGAFSTLFSNPALSKKTGFINQPVIDSSSKKLTTKKLIEFGFMQEFIGRFGSIIELNKLTRDDFKKILFDLDNSIPKEYISLFAIEDVVLSFDDSFIEYIVDESIKHNTGARSLRKLFDESLSKIQFSILDDSSIESIKVSYINNNISTSVINHSLKDSNETC
jgi:ATP-dependent Clp protease ATP-binding subunit ClpX